MKRRLNVIPFSEEYGVWCFWIRLADSVGYGGKCLIRSRDIYKTRDEAIRAGKKLIREIYEGRLDWYERERRNS